MITIDAMLNNRFNKCVEDIRKVFEFKNDSIPFIINDVNYWLDGEDPELMPDDYFRSPASMVNYQFKKIELHLKHFNDHYIPFLHPWYGVGVIPSALGCEFIIPVNGDPSLKSTVLKKPGDIRNLSKPDPYRDGLMPKVLETIDYMVSHTQLPTSVTDIQGPLNIALSICGVENLYVWMCTQPDFTHEIMDFCADVLIDWITVQKKHARLDFDKGAWPHGIMLPYGYGGVCLSDDDCTTISSELYKEFVVPYNSKVLKKFGGGTIHFCGTAIHQLENFLLTDGLTGINNFCMGNFEQIFKMQELFENKIALMVCDFAPLDFDSYIGALFKKLKSKGTIIAIYIPSCFALNNGTYSIIKRDAQKTAYDIYKKLAQIRNKCQ
jgi:uroporphyrinogen-III decarboxylase